MGHVIMTGGIQVDPEKVLAIKKIAVPGNVTQLQHFFGCIKSLAKFLSHLSDTLKAFAESPVERRQEELVTHSAGCT